MPETPSPEKHRRRQYGLYSPLEERHEAAFLEACCLPFPSEAGKVSGPKEIGELDVRSQEELVTANTIQSNVRIDFIRCPGECAVRVLEDVDEGLISLRRSLERHVEKRNVGDVQPLN
jgi:hypothetical protein